jgi:hypothetical protein
MFSKHSLVHLMPSWCTLLPSTAITKLKVYVIGLHRLLTLMECFVVQMAGEACLLVCLTGVAQCFSPLRSSFLTNN